MKYLILILIVLFPFLGFSQDKIPVKQLDVEGMAGTGLDYDENTGKIVWGKHTYSSPYGIDITQIDIPTNEALNIGARPESVLTENVDSAFLLVSQKDNQHTVTFGNGIGGNKSSYINIDKSELRLFSNTQIALSGKTVFFDDAFFNANVLGDGTNPNGKVLTVDANDKVVLTEISPHNGEQVLQEAPTSAIFSSDIGTAGTETLDIGTIGNDWAYTIPAGTFLSTSDEIYIDISFRFEITNTTQSTSSHLYLHVTDGTNSFNVNASGFISNDKNSRPIDHIIITSRTSGLVYVMSPYSGTTSQSLDITKDITVSFRYNRDNASSEDVSILPVIIQTSDVNN